MQGDFIHQLFPSPQHYSGHPCLPSQEIGGAWRWQARWRNLLCGEYLDLHAILLQRQVPRSYDSTPKNALPAPVQAPKTQVTDQMNAPGALYVPDAMVTELVWISNVIDRFNAMDQATVSSLWSCGAFLLVFQIPPGGQAQYWWYLNNQIFVFGFSELEYGESKPHSPRPLVTV